MKILYALQGTGNGHIARANEILPYFKQHAQVDVFVSGANSQLQLHTDAFKNKGLSLFYSHKGGLDYPKIFRKNSLLHFTKSVWQFPIEEYDLIVNDFEPITAYAAKLRSAKIIGLSHQAAVLDKRSPQPEEKRYFSEFIFKKYAPTSNSYGFHFKKYTERTFLPVIRKKIREMTTETLDYYLVYLPSYSDTVLQEILSRIEVPWIIFSPFCKQEYQQANLTFFPVNDTLFMQKLSASKGVLCGAGFEFPAEVLYLKKALYVIPIKGQFEQYCNYLSLREIGVMGAEQLDIESLQTWIATEKIIDITFENEIEQMVTTVLKQ